MRPCGVRAFCRHARLRAGYASHIPGGPRAPRPRARHHAVRLHRSPAPDPRPPGRHPTDPATQTAPPDLDGDGQPDGGTADDPVPLDTFDWAVCADGTADFTALQPAVDAAAPGDAIGVCPGTYGPFTVAYGQDVTIASTHGPTQTTLDGGDDTAVFVHEGTLRLAGFTVTGTGVDEEWSTDHGGAFTVEEGDLTVADAVVTGVQGPFALVFDENLLLMDDVVWTGNDVDVLWFLWQGDDATFTGNTVTGGTYAGIGTGGRLGAAHLRHNVFADLTIDAARTALSFTSTDEIGPMLLENNVFYDVDDLDPWGGRLVSDNVTFRNNIVQGCASGDLVPFWGAYNAFFDNQTSYDGVATGAGNLEGLDPLLVDPEGGDFHLQPGSPAIDAGDPGPTYVDADGSRNDIGRYGGR
ncbi:MAG: hypothetical protein R3F59_01870 [Myxococcota bacterium]